MDLSKLDILWVLLATVLVFLMQAGFMCLETGLTRSKNNINVAIKNLSDLFIAVLVFWTFGYGLIFGTSFNGVIGIDNWFFDTTENSVQTSTFFLYQIMFGITAATIVSGAVAERVSYKGYLIMTFIISSFTYPIFAHWVWNNTGTTQGWLAALGFVDFAGTSVVHSVGGWFSLAAVIVIGPRLNRFSKTDDKCTITPSSLPLTVLGVLLLWVGWLGFNGGSTLAFSDQVPSIIINTVLAGAAGAFASLTIGWFVHKAPDVLFLINGSLAGLVSITASCHAVSQTSSIVIGTIGGLIMLVTEQVLERYKIDDAVGAIPVHLGPGIWGTLAVGIFGSITLLDTGLNRPEQIGVQLIGILSCGFWAFCFAWSSLKIINNFIQLRVSNEYEELGLNVSEHNAFNELYDLLNTMSEHALTGNLSSRVTENPSSEVGQIAIQYNRVTAALEQTISQTQRIIRDLRDGIISIEYDGTIVTYNPGAEVIFGYSPENIIGDKIFNLLDSDSSIESQYFFVNLKKLLLQKENQNTSMIATGINSAGKHIPIEISPSLSVGLTGTTYTLLIRDITERQAAEAALLEARLNAENAQADLEIKIRELQEFNKAAVGRELRMIELKHLVNKLSVALGKPVVFDLTEVDSAKDNSSVDLPKYDKF